MILPGDATESKHIDIPAVWRRYLGLGGGRAIIAVARATFTAPSDGHGSIELVLGTSVIAQTSAPIGASAVEITAAADITDLGGRNHFLLRVATRDLAGAGDTTVSGIAVGLAGDPLPNAGAAGPKDGSQFYFRDEDGALRTVSLGDLAAAVARLGGG